jgi:hypothetical protein
MIAVSVDTEYTIYDNVKVAHALLGSAMRVFVFLLGAITIALIRHPRIWLIRAGVRVPGLLAFAISKARS